MLSLPFSMLRLWIFYVFYLWIVTFLILNARYTHHQNIGNIGNVYELNRQESTPVKSLTEGIFWSDGVEEKLPKGTDSDMDSKFFQRFKNNSLKFKQLLPGDPEHCGNFGDNRFIVLEDGAKMCARYRTTLPAEGEVFSYHLSQYLGVHSVPPVKIHTFNSSDPPWSDFVFGKKYDWVDGNTVALIAWVDDITGQITIPGNILQALKENTTIHANHPSLHNLTTTQAVDLAQFSDMLVLDFLLTHNDRLCTLKRFDIKPLEHRKYSLHSPIRNLYLSKDRKFWTIDNENTFFMHRHLYERTLLHRDITYIWFNKVVLERLCIFRKSTVTAVRNLAKKTQPLQYLVGFISERDQLFVEIYNGKSNEDKYELDNFFKARLQDVVSWFDYCEFINGTIEV